jgi:adenylate kinase family enzyme
VHPTDGDGPRIAIHGASGSGKSTLARRLAAAGHLPRLELDAVFHLPNWESRADDEFSAIVRSFVVQPTWVIDGNYRVVRPLVWERATVVVLIDRSRLQTTWRVLRRALRRVRRREELWNGNREKLSNLVRWNPERNIVRWTWTTHHRYRDEFPGQLERDAPHLPVVPVRTDRDAERVVAALLGH